MTDKTSNEILSKVFLQYDIKETSIHLQISNLNIHLYADENYSGTIFGSFHQKKQYNINIFINIFNLKYFLMITKLKKNFFLLAHY